LGEHYQAELKRLSKKLLTAKRNAQETLLGSVLQNEGKSWSEFYRFVNSRKGNRVNIPTIKDCNGGLITDPVDKENNLNNYYASVFSCKRDIPDINSTHSDKHFTIKISIIRKQLAMIGRNKSVGPDNIPGSILKMGGEAMIPYLARLLEVTINNGTVVTGGCEPTDATNLQYLPDSSWTSTISYPDRYYMMRDSDVPTILVLAFSISNFAATRSVFVISAEY